MSWARSLYSELIGHWSKRNGAAMELYNLARIDRAALRENAREYGGKIVGQRVCIVAGAHPTDQRVHHPSANYRHCFAATAVEDAVRRCLNEISSPLQAHREPKQEPGGFLSPTQPAQRSGGAG